MLFFYIYCSTKIFKTMKKKKLNLGKLHLKKAKVATLESNSVTGGFQSWTGTAEPCFSDFDCNLTDDCHTVIGCPPRTRNCYTNTCPPQTNNCGTLYGCGQTALYSACNGLNCY